MTDRRVETIGRRVIEEGWNDGRLETIYELVSEDYLRTGTTRLEGATGFAGWIERMRTAVTDLHVSIEDVVTDARRGAIRTVISGTHNADLFGMPATGRRFAVDNMVFIHVRDGRLYREWECTDVAGFLRQLGTST